MIRTQDNAPKVPDTECFACIGGVVFIGYLDQDSEAGEEVEVFEPVPCRRCEAR